MMVYRYPDGGSTVDWLAVNRIDWISLRWAEDWGTEHLSVLIMMLIWRPVKGYCRESKYASHRAEKHVEARHLEKKPLIRVWDSWMVGDQLIVYVHTQEPNSYLSRDPTKWVTWKKETLWGKWKREKQVFHQMFDRREENKMKKRLLVWIYWILGRFGWYLTHSLIFGRHGYLIKYK